MIGKKSFEIFNADSMFAGMSSSPFANDNGFASSGGSLNPATSPSVMNFTARPGIAYPPGPVTDRTPASDLTSLLISSGADSNLLGYNRVFVSDDAKYYSFDGTTLTLRYTDATANRQYTFGKTNMITLGFSVFTSSSGSGTGVVRWITSTNAFTANFFAFSDTLAPHPGLVFENMGYWGDGDLLLRQADETDNTPDTVLDLEDNAIITALGVDPGSGRMLIATSQAINMSDTENKLAKILIYDGFSSKPLKSIPVDDQITAFYNVGGTVYIFYGNKMGYWNGAGITFLRTLNVEFSSPQLMYPGHVTNIDNTLLVVEQRNILAFGEIQPGNKVFHYILKNNAGDAGNYSLITNIGSKKLALSFAEDKFYTFDTSSVASVISGGTVLFTKRVEFERQIEFAQLVIEFITDLPTNTNILTPLLYTEAGFADPINLGSLASGTDTKTTWEFPYQSVKCRSIQVGLSMGVPTSGTYGIRRITVFYNDYD